MPLFIYKALRTIDISENRKSTNARHGKAQKQKLPLQGKDKLGHIASTNLFDLLLDGKRHMAGFCYWLGWLVVFLCLVLFCSVLF